MANKARLPEDGEFFTGVCGEYGLPLAGVVPHEPAVMAADRVGTPVELPGSGPLREAIEAMVDFVESPQAQRAALEAEKERIERRLAELASR